MISEVPKGSVHGPLLFLICIDGLRDIFKAKVRLFAYNTILYNSTRTTADTSRLQQDLGAVEKWENKWQIGLSVAKRRIRRVTKKRNPIRATYRLHQQAPGESYQRQVPLR